MIKRFIKRVKTLTHLRVAVCPTAETSPIRPDFGVDAYRMAQSAGRKESAPRRRQPEPVSE